MKLADQLRQRLQPASGLLPGDIAAGEEQAHKEAAVLIAVTDRPEPGVILTVRRDDLRTHAGQIAFPGGRIDAGETATQAAVREAWEELALEPASVETIVELDTYRTVTSYLVTPVLAAIPPDLPLVPHDAEVADWFEAPLAHLIDPANQHLRSALFRGQQHHYYEIEWNGRKIWGATAAMLVNLSRRLRREVWS